MKKKLLIHWMPSPLYGRAKCGVRLGVMYSMQWTLIPEDTTCKRCLERMRRPLLETRK
jgi:hypothetical protein